MVCESLKKVTPVRHCADRNPIIELSEMPSRLSMLAVDPALEQHLLHARALMPDLEEGMSAAISAAHGRSFAPSELVYPQHGNKMTMASSTA